MTDERRFPPPDPDRVITRDARPGSSDRLQKLRSQLGAYIDDHGPVTREAAMTAHQERLRGERASQRTRRPSAVHARIDAMVLLNERLRSSPDLDGATDATWRLIHDCLGAAYDAGERRGEVKLASALSDLSQAHADLADAEARALSAESTHRRERLSGAPPSETQMEALARCSDMCTRLRQRCTYLEAELEGRGVRIPPLRDSDPNAAGGE